METIVTDIRPHPLMSELLFAHKGKVSSVFRDILGLFDISHIAITHINERNELITLSSTPAIEFNLFNSNLWIYDKTYHPEWFNRCTQADWQSLYDPARYDELYYLKQIKPSYPVGCSLAVKIDEKPFIFSLASHKDSEETLDYFKNEHDNFYKIGQYCSNLLYPLLTQSETVRSETLSKLELRHES